MLQDTSFLSPAGRKSRDSLFFFTCFLPHLITKRFKFPSKLGLSLEKTVLVLIQLVFYSLYSELYVA